MNIAQSTTNENLSIEEKIFLLNKKLEKLNQMFNEEYMNGQSVNTIRSCINEVIKEKETLEKLLISKKRKNRKIIPIKKKSSIVVKMDSNRKNENKITIFENLKINFDGSKGIYEITWRELGDYKFRTFDLDKNLISESSDRDLNLELFLKEFDNEYQTDLYESYLNNEICVTYDVRHLSKTLNKKERKIFKKNINNYRKNNYNNEVISRIFDTKKIAAAAAMVGLTLATLLSGRPSEAKANRNDEKIISESKKDDNIEITELKIDNFIDKMNLNTEERKQYKEEPIKIEKVETPNEIEENIKANLDIKIGDNINLNNIDLYYSSLDNYPVGNTCNLDYSEYKIGRVAIINKYNKELVKVLKENISLSEIASLYNTSD